MKKKIITGTIILIILAALVGIIYASIKLNGDKKEKESHLITINYKELKEKIEKKEDFILVITQTGCSHCEAFKPKFTDILAENNLTAYELNKTNLNKKEQKEFNDIASISGTPTTIFFKNGEEETVINRLVGDVSIEKINSKLKSLGYIK